MRKKLSSPPNIGDIRTIKKFAILPIRIEFEVRWLEKVRIHQEYKGFFSKSERGWIYYWDNIAFIDEKSVVTSKNWSYEVKCRRCGTITKMHHSDHNQTKAEDFKTWAKEHSTFPIEKQCECNNGHMMFHDIVSYGNVLDLIKKFR